MFFKIPCISDNIWHLSFSSLSLTPSRFIYIVANGKYMFILLNTLLQLFPNKAEKVSTLAVSRKLKIYNKDLYFKI